MEELQKENRKEHRKELQKEHRKGDGKGLGIDHRSESRRGDCRGQKVFEFKRATICLLLAIAFFVTSVVFANIDEEIKKKELEKEQILHAIEEMEKSLLEKSNIIEEVNIKIFKTAEGIRKLESEIEELDRDVKKTELEISMKEQEIDAANQELEATTQLLYKRLRVMYKAGAVGYLEVLFGADSMQELLSRADVLQRIVSQDQELIDKLEVHREKLEVRKKDLEYKRGHLSDLLEQRVEKMKQQEAYIADLYAYSLQVEQDRIAFEEQVRLKQLEQAEIARMIEQLELSKIAYAGGDMLWPVPSSFIISSPFGPRPELVAFGAPYFHTGMDIQANTGESVVAAQSGRVLTATFLNSYGNTIVIDHGGGIVTLYAHLNAIYVESGQDVDAGEVIGEIGSTGLSSGPHLHFEVREDGVHIDPMVYVGFYLN